jgi:hypothetical protein
MRRAWFFLVVVFVLVLAGCGGAPEQDAEGIAEDASAALASRGTLRFAMRAEESEQPTRCEGAVDYERRRVHMTCVIDDLDFEIVTIGRDEYSRGLSLIGSDDREQARRWNKVSGDEETAAEFPDPRELLRGLRRGAISSERLGREQVRGVETTRYRVVVDPENVEPEESVGRGTTATLELWIDDDDLLRRLRGADAEEGALVTEFYAFGEPVAIEPPPAGEVDEGPERIDSGCAGGETTPFRRAQVAEALRRNGFIAGSDPSACFDDAEAVVGLSNVIGASDAELERGFVTCRLRRAPDGDARDSIREERSGSLVVLELANLLCTLLGPGGDEPLPERLADLRRTFVELRRSLP